METEVSCGYITVSVILKSYVELRISSFLWGTLLLAHAMAQLVEALRYKPEDRRFESRLWPHSSSRRNECHEYFLGVKAAGA